MNLTTEQIKAILDGAPDGAVNHCLYDYGDSMHSLYIDCENEFYDPDEKIWVDMCLVDNYFHSQRRLSDLREILKLRERLPKWINVDDELPKKYKPVWCWGAQDIESDLVKPSGFEGYYSGKEFKVPSRDASQLDSTMIVTHWMPLPKPPEKTK